MCVHTHEGALVKTCKLRPHPLYTAVPPFNSSGPGMFYKRAEVTWVSACRVLGPGSVVGVAVMAAQALGGLPVPCGVAGGQRRGSLSPQGLEPWPPLTWSWGGSMGASW